MEINLDCTATFFCEEIQGKRPHLFKNAISKHNVTWKLVNQLLARHDHTSPNFKIMQNGLILKQEYLERYEEVLTTKHRVIKPKLYKLMKNGASLVLNKIDGCMEVERIQRFIAQLSSRQTVVSGYASFGEETSFGNHWDTHDVFAIQLIGRKRWVIYPPTEKNPLYKNSSVGREAECSSEPCMELILEAGDIFYLPRGWWHEVRPTGSETFHLAVGTYPPYISDYFTWICEKVATENQLFRLDMGAFKNDASTLSHATRVISEAAVDKTNYMDFLQQFSSVQRLPSSYAIEIFGNSEAGLIPTDRPIVLNANDTRSWHNDTIIINGAKLTADTTTQEIINFFATQPGASMSALAEEIKSVKFEQLHKLVHELIYHDILSIELPNCTPA